MKSDFYYRIDSYKKVNVIFILLIAFAFFYCYFLPYLPIKINSACEGMPEIYCKSRGLTRAFSEFLHLNFENGIKLNVYSLNIFCFFLFQFIFRFFLTTIVNESNVNKLIRIDIILSFLFFILAFYKLIFIG